MSALVPVDSLKKGMFAVSRGARPGSAYTTLYRGKVVAQSGDLATVDLFMDDDLLPPMSKVPLKIGVPGVVPKIAPGVGMLVGWENGDPQRPQAFVFEAGATVLVLTINADKIELGGPGLNPVQDGVVRAETQCQFTGAPHFASGKTSLCVLAKVGP